LYCILYFSDEKVKGFSSNPYDNIYLGVKFLNLDIKSSFLVSFDMIFF